MICFLTLFAAISATSPPHLPLQMQISAVDSTSYSQFYEPEAELLLLKLVNEARSQAGVPPLHIDEGLTRAARQHSQAMARAKTLSHQLPQEASLTGRIAGNSDLHLDHVAENVSLAENAVESHQGLMHSPPHRENILDSNLNIIGIGVVRADSVIYVTEDFGHSLPEYSGQQAEELVSSAVGLTRRAARLPLLSEEANVSSRQAACDMAHADSLDGPNPSARYVLRYTTLQPATLPANAISAVQQRDLHAFSTGICFARTAHYPNGAYWVVLFLY